MAYEHLKIDRKASDNKYLHRDFHVSADIGIAYVGRYYGDNGVKEYLTDFTKSYYQKLVEEIKEFGLIALEKYLKKIARLGRACGVHLIIATQRPSAKVVTGEIKANIGCRIALQTTSMLESRIILDRNGAETLKGKGDAILKLPTGTDEIHLQCPMITDEQILKTIKNYIGD